MFQQKQGKNPKTLPMQKKRESNASYNVHWELLIFLKFSV